MTPLTTLERGAKIRRINTLMSACRLIPKRNSAIFADFCRFLFCFVNVCFSDANIAILFQSVFAYFD
jgi:hypothetical protein